MEVRRVFRNGMSEAVGGKGPLPKWRVTRSAVNSDTSTPPMPVSSWWKVGLEYCQVFPPRFPPTQQFDTLAAGKHFR